MMGCIYLPRFANPAGNIDLIWFRGKALVERHIDEFYVSALTIR
jgi:hypothetical protein